MKAVVCFKAPDGKFTIRIDIYEIAVYMPALLIKGKDSKKGTTIILKSGESIVVQECTDKLDKLFSDRNILIKLN